MLQSSPEESLRLYDIEISTMCWLKELWPTQAVFPAGKNKIGQQDKIASIGSFSSIISSFSTDSLLFLDNNCVCVYLFF